jgi:hypothetical protein
VLHTRTHHYPAHGVGEDSYVPKVVLDNRALMSATLGNGFYLGFEEKFKI